MFSNAFLSGFCILNWRLTDTLLDSRQHSWFERYAIRGVTVCIALWLCLYNLYLKHHPYQVLFPFIWAVPDTLTSASAFPEPRQSRNIHLHCLQMNLLWHCPTKQQLSLNLNLFYDVYLVNVHSRTLCFLYSHLGLPYISVLTAKCLRADPESTRTWCGVSHGALTAVSQKEWESIREIHDQTVMGKKAIFSIPL